MKIMRTDLGTHGAALAHYSTPPVVAALEFEYADFALWEHSRGHDEAALSWWVSQLRGAPECISLPQDRPRPKEQATAGSRADVHFDRGIIARAIALCASANATMNSTVLALWSVMLLHLSQADLVVGLPHSMRYCLTNSHSSQPCLHSMVPVHSRAGTSTNGYQLLACSSIRCHCCDVLACQSGLSLTL